MTDTPTTLPAVDVRAVMALIPHRFPMLLVDRVEDIVRDRSARGSRR